MVLIKKILAASFCGDFLKISNRKKKKNKKKKRKKRKKKNHKNQIYFLRAKHKVL